MKKTLISMAVTAALAGGAGIAQAVNISEDNLGQVLLFPYYTVNGDFDTYINVTNTSPYTAMFKIRFREAHNSRDARDFNVIMSPYDVWTGTVTMADDTVTPRVQTSDTTCTAPRLPVISGNLRGVNFTNLDYTNPGTGGADMRDWGTVAVGQNIARTQQGHVEVILMGLSSDLSEGSVGYYAKHGDFSGSWRPRDCDAIVTMFQNDLAGIVSEFNFIDDVLKGSGTLLKAGEGKAVGYDPVVLANWRTTPIIQQPDSLQPNLNNTSPALADTLDSVANGYGTFTRGVDAVSALLMADSVINQFSVNVANNAATDWVITFPTKNFYVDTFVKGAGVAIAPFLENFQAESDGLSCMDVRFSYFDREERSVESSGDLNFSPAPPGSPGATICKETNVITFNNSDVLGAPALGADFAGIRQNVALENNIVNGWMKLGFTNSDNLVDDDGATWGGLPVTGFAITTREDGVSASERLSYGTAWSHAYTRSVTSNF